MAKLESRPVEDLVLRLMVGDESELGQTDAKGTKKIRWEKKKSHEFWRLSLVQVDRFSCS